MSYSEKTDTRHKMLIIPLAIFVFSNSHLKMN